MQQPDRREDIVNLDLIGARLIQLVARALQRTHITRLLFQELERITHHRKRVPPVMRDRHHGNDARLEAVLQHERSATSAL